MKGILFITTFIFFIPAIAGATSAEYELVKGCDISQSTCISQWANTLVLSSSLSGSTFTFLPANVEDPVTRNINFSANTNAELCKNLSPQGTVSTISEIGWPVIQYTAGDAFNVRLYSTSNCTGSTVVDDTYADSVDVSISYDVVGQPITRTLADHFGTFDIPAGMIYSISVQTDATTTIYGAIGSGLDYTVPEYAYATVALPEECGGAVCTLGDISGCAKVAMCWAFIPSANPDWGGLGTTIGRKPPFGYISALNAGLQGLTASDTPAFSLMSTTTRSDFDVIFSPVRAGILWLFWFAGAIWLYNRSKQIQV